jgi:hypothetical protein
VREKNTRGRRDKEKKQVQELPSAERKPRRAKARGEMRETKGFLFIQEWVTERAEEDPQKKDLRGG